MPVETEIAYYPRAMVMDEIGVGDTQFGNYLRLLRKYCGSEFNYKSKQQVFSQEQYRMLIKLRYLFKKQPEGSGLNTEQVIDLLITKGI